MTIAIVNDCSFILTAGIIAAENNHACPLMLQLFRDDSLNTDAINGKPLINDEPCPGTLNQAVIKLHGSLAGVKVFQPAMTCRALPDSINP